MNTNSINDHQPTFSRNPGNQSTDNVMPGHAKHTASPLNPNLNRLLSDLQSNETNDNNARPPKRQRNITLTPAQFNQLLTTYATQTSAGLSTLGPSPTSIAASTSLSLSLPAYYSNAKYEEIFCKAIKPLYDSSEEKLIPFLTKIILYRQHEGWAPATFITIADKKYNLTTHFALLTNNDMHLAMTAHWESEDVDKDKHTVGHSTYNARLLSMVIMNSITDEFMITLIHKVPTILRNDGTYLLWAVSHNIHRNNGAFHEHIRDKIRTATLAQHDNNIIKYIMYVKNHLKMITPVSGNNSTENGLLTYILRQLKQCSVHLFQEYIRTLHVAFQEGKHLTMTPTTLLSNVEDKIRALKHTSEWTIDEAVSTPAMALVSTSAPPSVLKELLKQQTSLLSKPLEKQKGSQNTYNDWKYKAPANLQDIRRFNGKIFRWCTKCNNGQGQWASAHDTKCGRISSGQAKVWWWPWWLPPR